MELRQLRYFLSVADNRSFVSAAANLYISRQAVSKAISQLEAELGVELFVRDPSGAFLTPTGVLFYERIRGLLGDLDNLTDQIRNTSSRYCQRIRLAFAIGTVSLVEKALLSFRDNRENLELVYSEHSQEECSRLLQEHQIDIMITGIHNLSAQFLSEEILRSPIGVLMQDAEELEDMDALEVSDLSWLPIAAPMDKQIQEFCSKNRIVPTYQGQDYHRLFSFAKSGQCALLLPKCLIPEGIDGLRWLPMKEEVFWKLYCTYSQSAESDLLYSFVLDELRQQVLRPEEL